MKYITYIAGTTRNGKNTLTAKCIDLFLSHPQHLPNENQYFAHKVERMLELLQWLLTKLCAYNEKSGLKIRSVKTYSLDHKSEVLFGFGIQRKHFLNPKFTMMLLVF